MLEESLIHILTSSSPPRPDPVNGDQLLHDISQFIGRYLQCTEHQRTVMALWINIYPRVQRLGPSQPARGYQLQDFIGPWQTYLAFDLTLEEPEVVFDPEMSVQDDSKNESLSDRPAKGTKKMLVTDKHPSEIANKDAGCNAVTHFAALPVPAQPITTPPPHPMLRNWRSDRVKDTGRNVIGMTLQPSTVHLRKCEEIEAIINLSLISFYQRTSAVKRF